MGRPLNKKYFGNRNIGTGGYQVTEHGANDLGPVTNGDDRIGGEGFAGVLFTPTPVVNSLFTSGAYLDKMPHITAIGAPTIANGVQAVADVTNVEAVFAVPNNKGTGYQFGDIVVGTTGTGTKARFRVTALRVVSVTKTANGTNYDNDNFIYFDSAIDSHWTTDLRLDVTSNSAGALGNFTVTQYGVWTGSTAPTSVTATMASTRFGADQNAAGAQFDLVWGIEAVEVVTGYQGDYTAVDSGAQAVNNVTVSGTPSSATLDIFYGVKTITVTEKGSGYTGAETITFTAPNVGQSETRAVGTMVITTDSGAVGSATNQENAIIAYAYIDGLEEVDIVRQVSTNRYRINSNATGNSDVGYLNGKLVYNKVANAYFSSVVNTPGETEMNIWAFDASGGSYLVRKLTAHRATVYPFACARLSKTAGTIFAAGRAVPWKFFEGQANADAGYVKLENA